MSHQYELINTNSDIENNISNGIITNEHGMCSICLEPNDVTSTELSCKCKNKFHKICIDEMINHNVIKCPNCRISINYNTNNETKTLDWQTFCFALIFIVFAMCVFLIIILYFICVLIFIDYMLKD